MKTNYLLKQASVAIALFGFTALFAQTPKMPDWVEIENPVTVDGSDTNESFLMGWECAAAWGDYNNDGYLDLILAGMSERDGIEGKATKLYKNNGNSTLTEVIGTPFPHLASASAVWFDYNNDRNIDLFLSGKVEGEMAYSGLWKNLGDDEFEEVFSGEFDYLHNGWYTNSQRYVTVADYDNDGWVDLHIQGENGGKFSILYKNINGTGFEKVNNPVNGEKPFLLTNGNTTTFADYNNDGYMDLLTSGWGDNEENIEMFYPNLDPDLAGRVIAIYKNNGDGTFAEPIILIGGQNGETAWGDYDNDGLLDLMTTGRSDVPIANDWLDDLYRNEGNGIFSRISDPENGFPGSEISSIAWGDVNNDGYEDIVHLGDNKPVSAYLNNYGDQTFSQQQFYFVFFNEDTGVNDLATGSHDRGTICLVDIDNDNDLDLFSIGGKNITGKLMRNDLSLDIPVNEAPSAPTNLQSNTENGITTFTWDASTDDLTPTEAIKYNLFIQQGDVIMTILPADLTTGRLKVNETLAPLTTTFYELSGLQGEYTWGVQAIDNTKSTSLFSVYNPTLISDIKPISVKVTSVDNTICIDSDNELQGSINVYSISGVSVYSQTGSVNHTKIKLQAGVYIVKVNTPQGTIVNKTIVK